MSDTVHVPVLPAEVLELGAPQPGQIWVDGTAGGGGHSRLIAEQVGASGKLIAVDRDPAVVQRLRSQIQSTEAMSADNNQEVSSAALCLPPQCTVHHASYDDIPEVLAELGIDCAAGTNAVPGNLPTSGVDGILLDLGLSSDQLADRERGFSFTADGPLDMRFDTSQGEAAWEWLERVDERTLADTIYQFGEERFSRRIAKRIVDTRKEHPIRNASELRELIYRCVPGKKHGRIDPATRTFQALRIAVNDELGILERALQRLPDCLKPGGALLIISFHSLEDRLVKYAFRNDPRLEIVTRRPVQATDAEVDRNSRSRSAKMRVARRVNA